MESKRKEYKEAFDALKVEEQTIFFRRILP